MLTLEEFDRWCDCLGLSEAAKQLVKEIRSSHPSRRVQGGKRNVAGCYPSRKMGVTIQFESHRNELARIYELESDSKVLEYYDQPPPIELSYNAKSGRQVRHVYTPDFFILYADSAGWEECKTEEELVQLAEKSPNRYQKDEGGRWFSPPAENYAQSFGLSFWIRSDAVICWTFQQNFIWLEDYFDLEAHAVESVVTKAVLATVAASPGIALADLFETLEGATVDDIYTLIATEEIYVDLNAALISEPQQVKVFTNRDVALAYVRVAQISPSKMAGYSIPIQVAVGAFVYWDGEKWQIVNTGATTTGLLHVDKLVELPNTVFEELLQQGKIFVPPESITQHESADAERILRRANPQDIIEANRRYEQIQPYLDRNSPTCPTRTVRRWSYAAFWCMSKGEETAYPAE